MKTRNKKKKIEKPEEPTVSIEIPKPVDLKSRRSARSKKPLRGCLPLTGGPAPISCSQLLFFFNVALLRYYLFSYLFFKPIRKQLIRARGAVKSLFMLKLGWSMLCHFPSDCTRSLVSRIFRGGGGGGGGVLFSSFFFQLFILIFTISCRIFREMDTKASSSAIHF